MWQRATGVIESQVHGDSHSAHASDLKIENCDVGGLLCNGSGYMATIGNNLDCGGRRTESSLKFVENPLGIGGDQNMHVLTLLLRGVDCELTCQYGNGFHVVDVGRHFIGVCDVQLGEEHLGSFQECSDASLGIFGILTQTGNY
jgi:hypothetical protein